MSAKKRRAALAAFDRMRGRARGHRYRRAEKRSHVAPSDREAINETLDVFVNHAVKRRGIAASYDVVTPTMRGGMTRKQWSRGIDSGLPVPGGRTAVSRLDDPVPHERRARDRAPALAPGQQEGKAGPVHLSRVPAAAARALARRLLHARGDVRAGGGSAVRPGRGRLPGCAERLDLQQKVFCQRTGGAATAQRRVRDRPVRVHRARPARGRRAGASPRVFATGGSRVRVAKASRRFPPGSRSASRLSMQLHGARARPSNRP